MMEFVPLFIMLFATLAVVFIFFTCASDAYDKGREDYLAGLRVIDNPYRRGSRDHQEWEAGYVMEQTRSLIVKK